MLAICGVDCCSGCPRRTECGGCIKTDGHPFGGTCIAAECINQGGFDAFHALKKELIREINSLGIRHLHVADLNLLNGFYVNLTYPLPNKSSAKFLDDDRAVGQANHNNPLIILVPCHRVIHKNGDLSGYACGDQVKRFLLKLEGVL